MDSNGLMSNPKIQLSLMMENRKKGKSNRKLRKLKYSQLLQVPVQVMIKELSVQIWRLLTLKQEVLNWKKRLKQQSHRRKAMQGSK